MIYYAGVGSRETPSQMLLVMRRCALYMAHKGLVLRSGAADGADTAFEGGCIRGGGEREIWLPWRGFNGHADTGYYPTEEHEHKASLVHPGWSYLSQGARKLHARNVGQILGQSVAKPTPVSFVVCWTADGCTSKATRTRSTGGTATAIVLAEEYGIPVFNLRDNTVIGPLKTLVRKLLKE